MNLHPLLDLLPDLGPADVLDMVVVSVLLYFVFVAVVRTRTSFLVVGLIVISAMYVAALALGLRLTTAIFQVIFAVVLVGLIVIFNAEIRVSFERLFSWQLHRGGRRTGPPVPAVVQTLVTVLTDFAKERVGAIIVLRGRDDPSSHVQGGYRLDGLLSEPLLESIFDPHSIGHDGAVIVDGNRVTAFGCHLPLSSDRRALKNRGTRHAAALGMASRTDAVCLVVSEERGTISIASEGALREVAEAANLTRAIARHYEQLKPKPRRSFVRDLLTRHLALKVAAPAAAILLWFLFVHESVVAYRNYTIPVEQAGLGPGLTVSSIEPPTVSLVVSGPRRAFYLMDASRFRLAANLLDLPDGQHRITLNATDVTLPQNVTFVNIVPRTIVVSIVPATPAP